MKKSVLFSLFLFSFLAVAFSQGNTGEIQGRVVDQSNEGIPYANVVVFLNDVQVLGSATDLDGYFNLKPLNPGKYRVVASYLGKIVTVNEVAVSSGKTTFLDKIVINTAQELGPVVVEYKEPPVDVGKPEAGTSIGRDQIDKMPKNNLIGIITNTGGTYSADDNSTSISINGSRFNANKYILDGVDMTGIVTLPTEALDEVKIITSGMDASIGDFTGGVVNLSTRGPSKDIHGTFEVLSSQFLDPYGYNEAKFSLLGPIWVKNKGTEQARSVLGYLITGNAIYEKDTDPPALPLYQVKEEILNDIKQKPLISSESGTGLSKRTEFLTFEDLEEVKYKPNNDGYNFNFFGKLDWKPTMTTNFTLGTTAYYGDRDAYVRTFSLLNPENNPQVIEETYRVYGKFFQRFPDKTQQQGSTAEERKTGYVLGNAYYNIQVDFQKSRNRVQDDKHEFNPFNYGHVGRFDIYKNAVYTDPSGQPIIDSVTGQSGVYVLRGYTDTSVVFHPGTTNGDILNPELTNYTNLVFEGFDINTLSQVPFYGGLRNGDFTNNLVTYSMWYNPGLPYTSYSITNNNQYGLRFDASFDLKKSSGDKINRHALEFGFEYQQKEDRSYQVNPFSAGSLWQLMRQNANLHLSNLNKEVPYFLIGGDTLLATEYLANGGQFNANTDTIFYYRRYEQSEQKYFDISLRERLGLPVNGLDYLNVDALDPEFFSLDMFSPDELLNSGNRVVITKGYDYYGNKLDYQPSFNDFFKKFNDKNGNGVRDFNEYYERPIDAFRPIYTAGYVQDRFNIGRVIFRVGLRVDRYDANQKVLRDPYSLYAIKSVDEVSTLGTHPSNIGQDYAVYVNSIDNPTAIVGYRDGDTWYDEQGNEIFDAGVLAAKTNNGQIAPYLVNSSANIKDSETFDPELSFEDYEPQISAMPRIAFSFPITETAMFTAHYDVLTQRPLSGNQLSPYHYLFLQEIAIDGVIPNPNLKPEKTINYQVGFQQALNDASRISLSAFYKELRDMTQIIKMNYAYPVNYTTYGNVDFGTVKGLTFGYDMIRRIRNIHLSASYTLQFANGTGSNSTSQINLVGAGQPNLRTIVPLNYDVRHTFNVNLDYRFGEGKEYTGPRWFDKDVLANAGVNLSFRGRSGEPFTRQGNATPEGLFGVRTGSNLEGSINGSRLPWNFKLDGRVDKDFAIYRTDKAPYLLNVYLLVQNVFDTRNIIGVYNYTGSPVDDGYLESPAASESISNQVDPQSFIDLYNIKVANPDNYSLPRRIQLGLKFKF